MRKLVAIGTALLMCGGSSTAMAQDMMGKEAVVTTKTDWTASKDTAWTGSKDVEMAWTKAGSETGWSKDGADMAWSGMTDMGADHDAGMYKAGSEMAWTEGTDGISKDMSRAAGKDSALASGTMDGAKTMTGEKTMLSYADGGIAAEKAASHTMKPTYASADMSAKPMSGYTGQGGPLETATDYPPCSASVTDRCIQLYERGVPEALAQWQASGGSSEQLAVGGPYEPVTAETPAGGTYEPVTQTAWSEYDNEGMGTAMGGPYEPVQEHADAGVNMDVEAEAPGDDLTV